MKLGRAASTKSYLISGLTARDIYNWDLISTTRASLNISKLVPPTFWAPSSNLPNISNKHDSYSNLDKTQDDLPMYTLDRPEARQSLGDGVKDGSNFEVHRKTETTIIRSDLCARDHSGDDLKDRVSPLDAHKGSSQVQNYSRLNSR